MVHGPALARDRAPAPGPGPEDRLVLAALAELLSYPTARTGGIAERIGLGVPFRGREVAALEEIYSATFDLQPACAPYVGHHLLGDDTGLRGPFLAKLADVYRDGGYQVRAELADHLAEVLGYLAVAPPSADRDDLVRDALLPALRKMVEAFEDAANPYRDVLIVAESTVRRSAPGCAGAGVPR